MVLPFFKAVGRGPVNAISAKPKCVPRPQHTCDLRRDIEPDDSSFLDMEGAAERPKCKELSALILPESESPCPNGSIVGL
jgi:hypothetical protein